MTAVSDRVRELRLAAGLSQTALAGESFSPSYISLIEAGRRVPTDAALEVLAARLDTTADYLRHGDTAPSEAKARLEVDYAKLALIDGDPVQARDRLLALDLDVIAPSHHTEILLTLARAHEALGDLEASVAVLEPLLARLRKREQHLDVAAVANELVASYLDAGDLHRSIDIGELVAGELEAAGLIGTDEHLRLASTVLWAYVERGDMLYATHRVAELVEQADAHGTPRGRGSVYWNAALVAEERRDFALAHTYTTRALALLGESSGGRDIPRLRLNYAWLLLRSEPPQPAEALRQLDAAGEQLSAVGSEVDFARVEVERSRAHLMLGDVEESERWARAAVARLEGSARLEAAVAHLALGDALYAAHREQDAAAAYGWAADMLGMMSASRQSAAAWRELGDRFLSRGDTARAAAAFDRALSEAGFRHGVPATVLDVLGASGSD
ncbi:helix-turn-helix transcriptional regulator [Cellulomonas sp. ATA003]|uniref:helix-turn-helix transcriptional regulator n=1 Tax=Cellulomonas sp. ATA003 TaxID=3073064 RepID=UPI002872BAB1|nr:helix-turn-helix transcriptional regulator [Cellulomonas sp. ATA003]WNB84610.1 helix-turn-helix transcriptional regulator [Cellulomonas sp. ATA003]